MSPYDDDDDWVGEPPEGFHTRDQANPAFWRHHWQEAAAMAALGIVIIIAVIVALAA